MVDSDESNASLYQMLGFDTPPTPLMEQVGGKKSVQERLKSSSSKNTEGSMNIMQHDSLGIEDIPTDCLRSEDGLYLAAIGKIQQ